VIGAILLTATCWAEPAAENADDPASNRPASSAAESDGQEEKKVDEQARNLVEQLGSETFEQRRTAEEQLRELGLAARDVIQQGLSSDDLQIRRTCQRLLNDILESDYQKRLARFENDTQGLFEHDLPGWDRYREIAGDDQAARKLFGEMHQAEGALLISTESGKVPMADALDIRYETVYRMMRLPNAKQRIQPSLATITALMFVASDPRLIDDDESGVSNDAYWSQLVNSPTFRQGLSAGKSAAPARAVLGQWIVLPTSQRLLNQKLRLAIQYEIPEGLDLALRTIEKRKQITTVYASYAIEALGKLGGKPYAAKLLPLLEEETALTRQRVNKRIVTIQLRDVALGWLIYLTGQDHGEYNLPRAKPIFQRMAKNPTGYSVSYSYMRFANEEQRKQALQKWNAWVDQNPLPKPPDD
jgi:hypothetical protein